MGSGASTTRFNRSTRAGDDDAPHDANDAHTPLLLHGDGALGPAELLELRDLAKHQASPQGARPQGAPEGDPVVVVSELVELVTLPSTTIEASIRSLSLAVANLSTQNAELTAQLKDRDAELKVCALRPRPFWGVATMHRAAAAITLIGKNRKIMAQKQSEPVLFG